MIPQPASRYPGWLALAGVLLLGLFLRVYRLDATSLWGDEVHTVARASTLQGVVVRSRLSPLALITRASLLAGDGEFTLRFPHAVLGIISIALLYAAGAAYAGRAAGLFAAFLLAISPFHVLHSREARYYSLMAFFSLLLLFLLERASRERRAVWFLAFAAAAALAAHNHFFSLIVAGALGSLALAAGVRAFRARAPGAGPSRRWPPLLAAGLGAGTLALLVYASNPARWKSLAASALGRPGGESRFDLELDAAFWREFLSWFGGGSGLPALACFALFTAGLAAAFLRRRELFSVLVAVGAFTVAALALVARLGPSHAFHLRYLICILPFYLLGVAVGVEALARGLLAIVRAAVPGPARRPLAAASAWAAAAAFFVLIEGSGLMNVHAYQFADFRGTMARLSRRISPGDAVAVPAFTAVGDRLGFEWYHARSEELRTASDFIVVDSVAGVRAAAAHRRLWFIDIEPVDGRAELRELREWIGERSVEVERLPHAAHARDLGPPVVAAEVVIRLHGGG